MIPYTSQPMTNNLQEKNRYAKAYASLLKLRNNKLQAARDLYYIHCQLEVEKEIIGDSNYALPPTLHHPTCPPRYTCLLHRYDRATNVWYQHHRLLFKHHL